MKNSPSETKRQGESERFNPVNLFIMDIIANGGEKQIDLDYFRPKISRLMSLGASGWPRRLSR